MRLRRTKELCQFLGHPVERYSMSTYTGVTNFQKNSAFFGPPCIYILIHKRFLARRIADRCPTFVMGDSPFTFRRVCVITAGFATICRVTKAVKWSPKHAKNAHFWT